MGNENSGRKPASALNAETKRLLHEAGLEGARLIKRAVSGEGKRIARYRLDSAEFAINQAIGKPTVRVIQSEEKMTLAEIVKKAREMMAENPEETVSITFGNIVDSEADSLRSKDGVTPE